MGALARLDEPSVHMHKEVAMGFASGRVSFRRYHIQGRCPRTIDERLINKLNENAFGRSTETSPDATKYGWITPSHLFDTAFDLVKVSAGRFLHLSLRIDRLGPPANVMGSYRRIEELAILAATGRPKLSRAQRREAREAAVARADKEARTGAFRRITAHPLVVDLEHQTVYFAATSNTAHERLAALFAHTFDAKLEPLGAAEVALAIAETTDLIRAYHDALPVHLVDTPDGAAETTAAGDQSFLGREFMTWLWYELETGDGTLPLNPDGRNHLPAEVAILIDKTLSLDCDYDLNGKDILHADGPTALPEAKAALHLGKQPTRMGLVLAADGDEYSLTLDATGLNIRGLKLPDVDEPNPQAKIEARCEHMVTLCAILENLYATFLKARLGDEAPALLDELRTWARGETRAEPSDISLRVGA